MSWVPERAGEFLSGVAGSPEQQNGFACLIPAERFGGAICSNLQPPDSITSAGSATQKTWGTPSPKMHGKKQVRGRAELWACG